MAAQASEQPQISLLHRSFAAAGASVVSAFVVNPLDVVKTRIHAQGALKAMPLPATVLEKWSFAGCECGPMPAPGSPAVCGPACNNMYTGTLDGLRKIARAEGVRVLWRGTDVALMMAIPMVGVYLPLYDYLLAELQQRWQFGSSAPLVAGSLARTAAVFCTAPFEYVRTRMQAGHLTQAGSPGAAAAACSTAAPSAAAGTQPQQQARARRFLHHLPSPAASGGHLRAAGQLWTGVGATLARDVPFSALYWGMVEPIRGALLPQPPRSEWEVFAANVTAGSVAGGLAGGVTTPLDVVKTRAQLLPGQSHPILGTLLSIARNEGAGALFQGWSARAAKAAPACAIVLSAYEMLKHIYHD